VSLAGDFLEAVSKQQAAKVRLRGVTTQQIVSSQKRKNKVGRPE